MATLLDEFYPFSAGVGQVVSEEQWRRMIGNIAFATGVLRGVGSEFAVIQRAAGANMSVDLGPGETRIRGHVGVLAAAGNIGIANNPTGNPRIDTIVLRADFVANEIEYDVLQGVAAVSPAAPALTTDASTHEIALANVAVASGAVSIVTANITDRRDWANVIAFERTWTIAGNLAVPSAGVNFIIPATIVVPRNWSCLLTASRHSIRGGTSATAKVRRAAAGGALADLFTGISVTTTPTTTDHADTAIANLDRVVPELTVVTSTPDNMEYTVLFEKYPTPLVA